MREESGSGVGKQESGVREQESVKSVQPDLPPAPASIALRTRAAAVAASLAWGPSLYSACTDSYAANASGNIFARSSTAPARSRDSATCGASGLPLKCAT